MAHHEQEELQRVICQVKGVEAAQINFSDTGEISEIHIAASPSIRAKNLARDVRSFLAATLGINVSHQKISIAVRNEEIRLGSEPAVPTATAEDKPLLSAENSRLLFRSVNLFVEGLHAEVHVNLTFAGREISGSATGVPAALGTERLIAEATLDALSQLIDQNTKLISGDLTIATIGGRQVVLSEVILVQSRHEQHLVGVCPMGQDRSRCIVFAILSALNRILGRITQPSRWIEFQVESNPQ